MRRLEAQRYFAQTDETPQQQSGAREQDHRQRDLSHDQPGPEAPRTLPGPRVTATLGQGADEIVAREPRCRKQSDGE